MSARTTRRTVLSGIASLSATAASGAAIAASGSPTPANPENLSSGRPGPKTRLSPEELRDRLQELFAEASELLDQMDDGRWMAIAYPKRAGVGFALQRRDTLWPSAGLYEVQYPSGPRIVLAERVETPVGQFAKVSFSTADHHREGTHLQPRTRFERRIIRRLGEFPVI